jgi:hypothetical protein
MADAIHSGAYCWDSATDLDPGSVICTQIHVFSYFFEDEGM